MGFIVPGGKRVKRIFVSLFAVGVLAGCGSEESGGAPTGQVAATVNGKEITATQVRAELGDRASDPAFVADQQPAALRAIINRKIAADAAVERGLDKTPAGAILLDKARDLALISLLEQSVRGKTAAVSKEEATAYVRDNPAAFGERRLVALEQLRVPAISPALLRQLEPLETLDEIAALLDRNKVRYQRGGGTVDPLTIDSTLARRIARLNVGDVFIVPANGGADVARIREVAPQPIPADQAEKVASNLLANRRASGQVTGLFEGIIKAGQGKVKINPAFQAKAAAQPAKSGG